ncbi:metallophosphoesterase family protein [Bacillus paranthracis]
MKVHFIQLSDIHFQYKDYNIMRMRDSLLEYLIELNKEDSIDFVVITGDIAHQAKGYTTDIIEFLDGVLKSTHLTIENMHIIPGNHDINRSKQMRNFVVDNIQGKEKVSSKLDGDIYTTLLEGQDEFFDFYSSYLQEQYPKEQLHFIKRYDKYNVFSYKYLLSFW